MKIFVSWSGEVSNKVALVFRDWLPSVIQAIEPYVSSEDIDKGARWSTDIAKELEASRFGILCVTRENVEAPWLNFEAGALSKTIDKSRVSPFLFGLKRSEIRTGPLLQFQSTIYEREDLAKLLHSLNNSAEPRCIDEARLDGVFEVWWPRLKEALDPHLLSSAAPVPPEASPKAPKVGGDQSEILEEILELARNQHKLLNSPEMILPPPYLEQVLSRMSFRDDINPEAVEELYVRWRRLREITGGLKEGEAVPREALAELLSQLENPIEYLFRRTRSR
jgi:hypothetical protein